MSSTAVKQISNPTFDAVKAVPVCQAFSELIATRESPSADKIVSLAKEFHEAGRVDLELLLYCVALGEVDGFSEFAASEVPKAYLAIYDVAEFARVMKQTGLFKI